MAKKVLVNLDLGWLEVFKFRSQNLAADPDGAAAGGWYFNTVTNKPRVHNGTQFVELTDRSQHTGTQTVSTLSDFSTALVSYRLDQFAQPTSAVNLNSQKISSLAPGSANGDAVNFAQLQAVKNNTDWKNSVRAATTANIMLSGLQTLDGISLNAGDRVLVKNQTDGTQNGFYLAASGVWSRTDDANDNGELSPSTSVFVEEGTTLSGTQWRINSVGTLTVGVSVMTWTQFGAAVSYVAGTGIVVNGATISADFSTITRKMAMTIGDGTSTSIPVSHGLGTQDILVSVRDTATNAAVDFDWTANSTSQVTLTFAVAPASGAYRVVVMG